MDPPRSQNKSLGIMCDREAIRHHVQCYLGKQNELIPSLKELNEFYEFLLLSPEKVEVFDMDRDSFICSHSNPKPSICEEASVKLGKECWLK